MQPNSNSLQLRTSSSTTLPVATAGAFTPLTPLQQKRLHYTLKFGETVLVRPISTAAKLTCSAVKLLTWNSGKALALKIRGHNEQAKTYWLGNYINTARFVRDAITLPQLTYSIYQDIVAEPEDFDDDLAIMQPQKYLSTAYTKCIDHFSSYRHGCKPFEVILPTGIEELPAESDGTLKAVLVSHFLQPGVMAINIGVPNLSTFITEDNTNNADNKVQTVKVDAMSCKRKTMTFHPTNGKMQSGIFFVFKNMPSEALERFKTAAQALEGGADITCVNTNCKVLAAAGFSIEGKDITKVIFPTAMMEHLLFRNFIYTDTAGNKHKVHFAIINTTSLSLEEQFEKIDIAIVSTRLRHKERNADTEENRKARGAAAKALIEIQTKRLALASQTEQPPMNLEKRKVEVSVPSTVGDFMATKLWGRHVFYIVHFSDKKDAIAKAFEGLPELHPFPVVSNFATKVKKYVLFSQPMVNFIHKHMMGRADVLDICTNDLFSYLQASDGALLNYVILEDKVILTKVNPNGDRQEFYRVFADWMCNKHGLAALLKTVKCAGELRFDKLNHNIEVNGNSGTYRPVLDHVQRAVNVANEIFETDRYGNKFVVSERLA